MTERTTLLERVIQSDNQVYDGYLMQFLNQLIEEVLAGATVAALRTEDGRPAVQIHCMSGKSYYIEEER